MRGETPPPGSTEALHQGCTCPMIDNGYGWGYRGYSAVFVYTEGCPVHKPDLYVNTSSG